jgi:hypothetical protein
LSFASGSYLTPTIKPRFIILLNLPFKKYEYVGMRKEKNILYDLCIYLWKQYKTFYNNTYTYLTTNRIRFNSIASILKLQIEFFVFFFKYSLQINLHCLPYNILFLILAFLGHKAFLFCFLPVLGSKLYFRLEKNHVLLYYIQVSK